jgi:hypothetical protein
VDESATGSANFYGPTPVGYDPPPMHLRPPSFDHGLTSGLWAIGFGLFILFGSIAVGLDKATAYIIAPLAAIAIYLLIRVYGQEDLRR